MSDFLNKVIQKISLKWTIVFTILFIVFFILINFSGIGVAGLLKITGGPNILDFEFGYNRNEAYQMLTALRNEGRSFYLTRILPIDFIFPLSYMLLYFGWIAFLIKHIHGICNNCSFVKHNRIYKYLLFIPILATFFDFIENIGIISMLINYPDLPLWAVIMASNAGKLKTIFTVGSVSVIIILIGILTYKRILRKRKLSNTSIVK